MQLYRIAQIAAQEDVTLSLFPPSGGMSWTRRRGAVTAGRPILYLLARTCAARRRNPGGATDPGSGKK
ncbi:hypothetical protein [Nitrosomonas sp.]|jgi:hypothetical protein|uniref:hypothetical protein n=1 Tax=Nitrosomonas sp. TaxID=42353 RepID=UPI0035AE0F76